MAKIFFIGALVMSIFMGIAELAQVTSFSGPVVAALGGKVGFGVFWFIYEGLGVLFLVFVLHALGLIRISKGAKGQL